ncbi:MAG: hypothetical protein WCF85_20730, partial [Rhodospirillaceae bacterium]
MSTVFKKPAPAEATADSLSLLARKIDVMGHRMADGFAAVNQRLDGHDKRFDAIDQRFGAIDQRFDGIDQR